MRAGSSCSPASVRAAHQRVEPHAAADQRRVGARGGDQRTGPPGVAQRADVAAGEVHAVDLVEQLPREVVVAVGDDPLADHGDRPLAGRVDVGEPAALDARARRGVDA